MTETDTNPSRWRSMSPEHYMKERVDDQLTWYSKKSAANKSWHFRLQLITLVAAALVPVVSLSSSEFGVRVVVAIIGSIAAIAAGVVALFQFRDLWVDYRSTAEQLKYEKFLFLTGSEPYSSAESFSLFVNQVESIIIQENRGWHEKIRANNGNEPSADKAITTTTDGE